MSCTGLRKSTELLSKWNVKCTMNWNNCRLRVGVFLKLFYDGNEFK